MGGTSPTYPKSMEPRFKPSKSCGPAVNSSHFTSTFNGASFFSKVPCALSRTNVLAAFWYPILRVVLLPEIGANSIAVSKDKNGTNKRNAARGRSRGGVLECWSFGLICFNGFIEYNEMPTMQVGYPQAHSVNG